MSDLVATSKKPFTQSHTKGGIIISISKTVNKTTVTGSESFIYTVKLAFPGLMGEFVDGTVEDFFPTLIHYELPPLSSQLVQIEEVPEEGGTRLIFYYESVPVGSTIEFTMSAYFAEGRREGDSFTNQISLYQKGVETARDTADTVTLHLEGNFYLCKYFYDVTNPKVGESFPCRICLRNQGDAGATISDVLISDALPTGLVADTSVTPTGKDSSASFPDTSQDGKIATWDNNTLYFPLTSYSGEEYTIEFRVQIDERVADGTTIVNIANWSVAGVEQTPAYSSITTYQEKSEASLTFTGPSTATMGGEAQYFLQQKNTGTVDLTGYQAVVTIPEGLSLEELRYTTDSTTVYSLYLTTSEDPKTEVLLGENLVGDSGILLISDYAKTDVATVIYRAETLKNDGYIQTLDLATTVKDSTSLGEEMTLTATITASSSLSSVDLTAETTTTVNNLSALQVEKSIVGGDTTFYPLDRFEFQLTALGYNGQTVSPIFADILPKELFFVADSPYYVFEDAFTGVTYDSRQEDFPLTLPEVTMAEDFQENGSTLLRFSFPDFTLQYKDKLSVFFSVYVKIGATEFVNYGYLGNPTEDALVYGASYEDLLDLDGDGFTEETIAMSDGISGIVLYSSEFILEKWIETQEGQVKSTTTTAGGQVIYQLEVTNNQDAILEQIDLVDILPYQGDTGVILVEEARDSAFSVYLSGEITAEVVHILTGETKEMALTLSYSTSSDPVRFDATGTGTVGTGTWLEEIPADLSTVRAIRVQTADQLNSYEKLVVTMVCATASTAKVDETAYNSFAVQANVTRGEESSTLLPTEPSKVAVTILDSGEDPLEQAKNDLITSIALEEMGIQAILNGEGAKIQKAVALDLTLEELLAVNDSVVSMVKQLTDLEKVLVEKVSFVAKS